MLRAVALVLGLAWPTGRAPAQAQDLGAAAELLQSSQEGDVHRGAELCVKANNAAAVELLLDVLDQTHRRSSRHLPPAHYRDVVWDSLKEITDSYARQRIEQELRRNRKNPRVRQWCAELLGLYGDQAYGVTLQRALHDRDEHVVQWAVRSLGRLRFQPAEASLDKLVTRKNPFVRANAIEALARISPQDHRRQFLAAVRDDKDGGVRCALLGALPELWPDEAEELSVPSLHDADWRPRMQAADNLGAIKTKTSVDHLIETLQDGRAAVARRALDHLQRMTGKQFVPYELWKKWWSENRATFAFPEGHAKEGSGGDTVVVYNGIELSSDHVAFLIDKSRWMSEPLHSKGTSKEDAALAELDSTLGKLEGRLVFNVFTYAEEVHAMAKQPVKLGKITHRRAVKFVATQDQGRAKDIWQVLENVVADPTLDTVYLLSSGEPDIGLYVHWNRVTAHLADLNRFHKVVVHTIAYSSRKWYRDQLEKIAEATGGQFRWFE